MSLKSFLLLAVSFWGTLGSVVAKSDVTGDLADYQAYIECAKKAVTHSVPDLLRMRPLRTVRDSMLKTVDQCASLLPADLPTDQRAVLQEQVQQTVILFTAPKDESGAKKGPLSVDTGLIVQTKTGASLLLQGQGEINFPKTSMFALLEGYKLRLSGMAYVGSTADGQSALPAARFDADFGRSLQLAPTKDQLAQLDQLQIDRAGVAAISMQELIGVTLDRDVAMDRNWDFSVHYGREAKIYGDDQGASRGATVAALVEGGVGATGDMIAPYLRLTVAGHGYICTNLSGNRHLLCLEGEVATRAGAVQLSFDVAASANYRYVAAAPTDDTKWFHVFKAGPQIKEKTQLDLAGGHAATESAFMLTIY